MTIKEIKEKLDEAGIEYEEDLKKADLEALLPVEEETNEDEATDEESDNEDEEIEEEVEAPKVERGYFYVKKTKKGGTVISPRGQKVTSVLDLTDAENKARQWNLDRGLHSKE